MALDRLVFEPVEGGLRAMDVGDGRTSRITASGTLLPLGGGSRATAGAERPGGAIILAPSGRLDGRTLMVLGRADLAPRMIDGVGR
jgi:hypothetical protein